MRMVYQLVGGQQLWRGRGVDRDYLLGKLQTFHRNHQTPISQSVAEPNEAFAWLPKSAYTEEAKPLAELARKKRRGAQSIGDLLVPLLIRHGVNDPKAVESNASEAPSSCWLIRREKHTNNVVLPPRDRRGFQESQPTSPWQKRDALFAVQTSDETVWSLRASDIYQGD